ncbi:MAG: TlpA family protein disulfide reductase [Thermoanaerobaculia bacterium]|nr:MAG: TlpA family protein disulfide reductase [Thermoanaerobaculia bacterium]
MRTLAAPLPLAVLLAAALAAWACAPVPQPAGDLLPSFRLAALDGRQLGPEALRGRVVLYDFWATWCGPCHVQAEILHALYPAYAGRGVEFVAVAVGEPEEVVREFVRESPHPYPVLLDPEDRLSAELRILGLPTLIVTDREGRVVFRSTGISDREALATALARAGA